MPNKIRKRRQPASRVSISPRRTRSHARKTQLDNKQPPPPSRPTTINKQSQRRQLPATVNKASTKKTNKPPNNDVPRLQLSDILSIPRLVQHMQIRCRRLKIDSISTSHTGTPASAGWKSAMLREQCAIDSARLARPRIITAVWWTTMAKKWRLVMSGPTIKLSVCSW